MEIKDKFKNSPISDSIVNKKFELTFDELLDLLKEAYRNGYSIYEMTDAGLEPYDADGYARWAILGIKHQKK